MSAGLGRVGGTCLCRISTTEVWAVTWLNSVKTTELYWSSDWMWAVQGITSPLLECMLHAGRVFLCLVHCFIPAGQQHLALIEAQWVSVAGRTACGVMVAEEGLVWSHFNREAAASLGKEQWVRIGVSEVGRQRLFTILQHELRRLHQMWRGRKSPSLKGIPISQCVTWAKSHRQERHPLGVMVEASAWVLRWD